MVSPSWYLHFLAVVLVAEGQTHQPVLSWGALCHPEVTGKHKYRSAIASMSHASWFDESNPGNALYRNVQQEKMVMRSVVC